jgi:hypothetical protein
MLSGLTRKERSPREWSRWDPSDMDGQTREVEASGRSRIKRCVVAKTPNLFRDGAVSFIDWLDGSRNHHARLLRTIICLQARI